MHAYVRTYMHACMHAYIPLQITLWSCAVNVICDPAFMFEQLRLPGGTMVKGLGLGIAGAALATTASQLFAAVAYLRLLLKKKLVAWHTLLRPPPKASLVRLAKAGGAVQVGMLTYLLTCLLT